MALGAFSVSLNVKDIAAAKAFYTTLGFSEMGGMEEQGWLILKNGDTILGLFQGMVPSNTLTFNPGWDQNAQNLDDFEDIRAIQQRLKTAGIELDTECDTTSTGPASFTLKDPDGNAIMFDQHR